MKEILLESTTDSSVSRALESVRTDSSILINELHTDRSEFDAAIIKLTNGQIFKTSISEEQKNRLYGFVQMKNTISEYVWNLLTGFLVTSVSYSYIINTGCAKSPLEMKKRYDAYEESESKKANDKKIEDKNKVVYTPS